MSEEVKIPRLGKAAKEFNVATSTIVEFLSKKGFTIEDNINTKLTDDMHRLLMIEYQHEKSVKEEAQRLEIGISKHAAVIDIKSEEEKLEKPVLETRKIEEKPKMAMPVIPQKTQKEEVKKEESPKEEIKKEITKIVKTEKKIEEKVKEKPKEKVKEKTEIKVEKKVKEPAEKKIKEKSIEKIEEKVEEKIEKIIEEKPKEIIEEKKEEIIEKTIEEKPEITEENIPLEQEQPPVLEEEHLPAIKTKIIGKLDLTSLNERLRPARKSREERKKEYVEKDREKREKEKEAKEKREKEIKEKRNRERELEKQKEIERQKEKRREKDRERKKAKREALAAQAAAEKEALKAAALKELLKKEEVPVKKEPPAKKEPEMIKTKIPTIKPPKVIGVLDLSSINEKTKPKRKSREELKKLIDDRIKAERALRKARRKEREKEREKERLKEREKQREKDKQKDKQQDTNKIKEKDRKPEKKGGDFIPTKVERLSGLKVVDKITLSDGKKDSKPKTADAGGDKREKRKRFKTVSSDSKFRGRGDDFAKNRRDGEGGQGRRVEISVEEVDSQIKKTMARMAAPTGKTKSSKYRREKRDLIQHNIEQAQERQAQEKNILKVTEFITANELAAMMNVPVNKVIATCMSVGLMVAINQRLDTENIELLAGEFGFQVQFVGVEEEETKQEEVNVEDLEPRSPIVTVMGHVDHGKTSSLDYIRKTNVIAGEAGGITQHIGAYEVELPDKRRITFLDTPGHEAFTAMRARGAKVTDIVIVVIAADDAIMPQTVEAINHAQAAGVPIIFAINKIDKPSADPEKIRNSLANMNLLVEEWGGKIQSQDIAAKKGINVDILMEKILIEAEMLELKANPKLKASGTIIESSLDKGRGYVAKALIQNGTLYKGDVVAAGTSYGKIKAMYNERNHLLNSAGPASPVLLLGMDSAPQAGDTFKVYENEKEAKAIVSKRQQLIREQGLRTQKHITLTEIGRRIAIGDFKEVNIIVKGDVDGSIEALSDALLRLTTEEVQVNVIHKSVGQVTESDILLASASNAIIIAFQVRPSAGARKLAEQELVDIRTYSIIYDAINDLKEAIEGMKAPELKENIVCNIEVREVFHISKVGVIAGCYVLDGKVQRSTQVRVIRDGIVVFTGRLGSLKRFKDDVKEVTANYECGLNIESYNDIKVGDIIEGFEQVEVKR
jgi:translation initiation factor IF-2